VLAARICGVRIDHTTADGVRSGRPTAGAGCVIHSRVAITLIRSRRLEFGVSHAVSRRARHLERRGWLGVEVSRCWGDIAAREERAQADFKGSASAKT
jgi:hypothetical protein